MASLSIYRILAASIPPVFIGEAMAQNADLSAVSQLNRKALDALQGTLSVEVKPQFAGGKLWACGVEFAAIERDWIRQPHSHRRVLRCTTEQIGSKNNTPHPGDFFHLLVASPRRWSATNGISSASASRYASGAQLSAARIAENSRYRTRGPSCHQVPRARSSRWPGRPLYNFWFLDTDIRCRVGVQSYKLIDFRCVLVIQASVPDICGFFHIY
jgi:hypothetical protein